MFKTTPKTNSCSLQIMMSTMGPAQLIVTENTAHILGRYLTLKEWKNLLKICNFKLPDRKSPVWKRRIARSWRRTLSILLDIEVDWRCSAFERETLGFGFLQGYETEHKRYEIDSKATAINFYDVRLK